MAEQRRARWAIWACVFAVGCEGKLKKKSDLVVQPPKPPKLTLDEDWKIIHPILETVLERDDIEKPKPTFNITFEPSETMVQRINGTVTLKLPKVDLVMKDDFMLRLVGPRGIIHYTMCPTTKALGTSGMVIPFDFFDFNMNVGAVVQDPECDKKGENDLPEKQSGTWMFSLIDRTHDNFTSSELGISGYRMKVWSFAGKPGKMAKMKAVSIGSTSVNLKWKEPANNGEPITHYKVQRGVDDEEDNTVVYTGPMLVYMDEDLKPSTKYLYKVQAKNKAGVSIWSEALEVTTKMKPKDDDKEMIKAQATFTAYQKEQLAKLHPKTAGEAAKAETPMIAKAAPPNGELLAPPAVQVVPQPMVVPVANPPAPVSQQPASKEEKNPASKERFSAASADASEQ